MIEQEPTVARPTGRKMPQPRLLEQHPLVTVERREHTELPGPGQIAVLATGPLTSEPLAEVISGAQVVTALRRLSMVDLASTPALPSALLR